MRIAIVVFSLIAASYKSEGQNFVSSSFAFPSDPYSVCKNEPLQIENTSQNATRFLWDFCPETFNEVPQVSQPIPVGDLVNGWGYKIVHHDGEWTGFLLSRNTNKLFRLEFGNDPASSPFIVDLGNPGNLLISPQGLEIVHQNGNWYGFVGKGETTSGQIVRLDFGASLHNTPAAIGLGTFGTTNRRLRDLKVIKQDENWVLLIAVDTDNALLRVNYGTSFNNSLISDNITSTGPLPNANLVLGFSVVEYLGNWIVHTVSFINHEIQQYSFGNDIFGVAEFQGSFLLPSVNKPYYVKVIREADSFYGFVANESRNLSIIKFGDFTTPPEALPNSNLPRLIGFDIFRSESKNIIQGSGSTSFSQVIFENESCSTETTFSFEKNPAEISFNSEGAYKIELYSERNYSQYDVSSGVVNVSSFNAPVIQLITENVCVQSPILFGVDSNVDLKGWVWDFGDDTVSGETSPTHTYEAPGDYLVTISVTDINDCMNKQEYLLSVFPAPVANFTLPSNLICTNGEINFVNTTTDIYEGNISYEWFVGDNSVGVTRDLQYSFNTVGPKEIMLITSIPGCSDDITKTTPTIEAGPIVDFSHTGACVAEPFQFNEEVSEAVESYWWDFGDGRTSSEPNAETVFETSGDFSVSLTVTNEIGCENVKSKIVAVEARPDVAFHVPGAPNACSGSPAVFLNQTTHPAGITNTEWLWEFGDAHNSTVTTDMDPTHIFTDPGVYQVSLTATTAAGCDATLKKEVIIERSPSADFTFTPACDDMPTRFSAPLDDVVTWYWEVESVYYETALPSHTFHAPGIYPVYLEVTGSNNCSSEFTRAIHVPVPLSPEFVVLRNCVNQETMFTDLTSGADAVVLQDWRFSGGHSYTGSSVTHSFTEVGDNTVSLNVTAVSGCSYEIRKTVEVLPSPMAAFSANSPTGAFPLEVHFINNSINATAYLWEFADGTGGTSTEPSPVYTFTDPGTYEVALKASNEQQCKDSVTALIQTVAPVPDVDIEMITATPNPDGSWKLIITLHNKGNTILKDIPVDIDLEGNVSLRQIAAEPILPASKYNLLVTTGVLDLANLRYVCASIELEYDRFPDGNRICREFNDFFVIFPGYPNPTPGLFNLEWIAPVTSSVRVTVIDAIGRAMVASGFTSVKGFNQVSIDLRKLQNGIYYLLIDNGTSKTSQRILVSSQP